MISKERNTLACYKTQIYQCSQVLAIIRSLGKEDSSQLDQHEGHTY